MTIVSVGPTGLGDTQWKVEFSDSFSFGQGKPPKIWLRSPIKTNEFLHQSTKAARNVAASEGKRPLQWPLQTLLVKLFNISGDKRCQVGFNHVPGDIKGTSDIPGGYLPHTQSTEECALECLQTKACKSYEYSPTWKLCNLNSAAEPDDTLTQPTTILRFAFGVIILLHLSCQLQIVDSPVSF